MVLNADGDVVNVLTADMPRRRFVKRPGRCFLSPYTAVLDCDDAHQPQKDVVLGPCIQDAHDVVVDVRNFAGSLTCTLRVQYDLPIFTSYYLKHIVYSNLLM